MEFILNFETSTIVLLLVFFIGVIALIRKDFIIGNERKKAEQIAKAEANAAAMKAEAERIAKQTEARKQEKKIRAECAMKAKEAATTHAAKQIEKTCLEEHGLKPKGWFD